MKRGTMLGLLLGSIGVYIGLRHSAAEPVRNLVEWASRISAPTLPGAIPSLVGFTLACLGIWLGARRTYGDVSQRRTYVALCVGILGLIVMPVALLRILSSPIANSSLGWLAPPLGVLALLGIALLAFMPRLLPPKR